MSKIASLISACRVSSVLNKDVKSFGKQFLLDGNEETCWNSEKGSPQWITLEFKNVVQFSTLKIQFQGGFVGQKCSVQIKTLESDEELENFYPEDVNSLQSFPLSKIYETKYVKILFGESTDFFGRIVIYWIDLL